MAGGAPHDFTIKDLVSELKGLGKDFREDFRQKPVSTTAACVLQSVAVVPLMCLYYAANKLDWWAHLRTERQKKRDYSRKKPYGSAGRQARAVGGRGMAH